MKRVVLAVAVVVVEVVVVVVIVVVVAGVVVVAVAVVDTAIFCFVEEYQDVSHLCCVCATRSSTDLCFSCVVQTWQSRLANADAFNVTCRKI